MVFPPWPLRFLLVFLSFLNAVSAIKFTLPAYRYPPQKCIWNVAHNNALVIVTANVGPGANQRVDIEIVDSGPNKNVYLSKRGIKGETRLAITTHAEGEVGVCLRNYVEGSTWHCHSRWLVLTPCRPSNWNGRVEQAQSGNRPRH